MNASPTATSSSHRLVSIDAVRGLIMLLMLVDHVRETVFLHQQVGDPVDVETASFALVLLRLSSSLCAPGFVFLAGTAAWLFGRNKTRGELAFFLATRGVFLIVLELLVIGTAWTGIFPPSVFYLQIIWCIGWCMLSLAALIYLPRAVQIGLVVLLIGGHNLLDSLHADAESWWHPFWAVLHQRDWITLFGIKARTSYPILPWIGVILAGYLIGPWFGRDTAPATRSRNLLWMGVALLAGFFLIRGINIYGDDPWMIREPFYLTILEFFSLTKYPASLLFLLFTLAFTGFGLWWFEKHPANRVVKVLASFGGAPMFFYILHLYILKIIYLSLVALFGTNQGDYYGVESVWGVLLWSLALAPPLIWVTSWFNRLKRRNRQIRWLKYL